ncbi:MAG: hypothetical protein HYR96_04175 [Deltaproteobacteria bacterium]|nr:hypothetical protein [Deltaproteobacteria bacterium]MBI3295528.1 hypothetical protein [Deltaproteobacteria bacterium]
MTNAIAKLKFGKAFLTLIKNPKKTDSIFDMADYFMGKRLDSSALEKQLNIRQEFRRLYEERYLPEVNVVELGTLPEGTLGREFADHMKRNNLAVDFYRKIEATNLIKYLSLRMRQTHDIWHVVTGFDTSLAGELGLQAFNFAQIRSGLGVLIIAGGLLHILRYDPQKMPEVFDAIVEGYLSGKKSAYLPAFKLEENWNTPLSDLRSQLNISSSKSWLAETDQNHFQRKSRSK